VSAARHTPGPWIVDGYRIHGPLDGRSKHRNGRVLVGGVVDDLNEWRSLPADTIDDRSAFKVETEANAHLIASAPDLLAACEKAYGYLKASGRDSDQRIATDLFAAISKAEGGDEVQS
jgi:hypothetical protein